MSTDLDMGYEPGTQELVDRAEGLVPLLRANAARGEEDLTLAAECVDALRDAGFFRMSVPRRLGGDEVDIRTQTAIIAAIGRGDPSAGWLVSITGAAEVLTSLVSETGAKEMFGASADAYVCANGGHHSATATRTDGGYRTSGRFPTISGCEIGDWMILAFVPVLAGGEPTGQLISMAAPPRAGRIDRTWDVAGMRATGSHTVEYDELFVPDSRVIEHAVGADGTLTNFPSLETFAVIAHRSIASLIGAAHGALDTVRAMLDKGKPLIDTSYTTALDSPIVREWLGQATHEVDTAYRHLLTASDLYDSARAAGSMSRAERTRARRLGVAALETARQAMSRILDLGGTSGFANANPLQRYWRDFEVGSHHIHFSKFVAFEDYSRSLLGTEAPVSLIH